MQKMFMGVFVYREIMFPGTYLGMDSEGVRLNYLRE